MNNGHTVQTCRGFAEPLLCPHHLWEARRTSSLWHWNGSYYRKSHFNSCSLLREQDHEVCVLSFHNLLRSSLASERQYSDQTVDPAGHLQSLRCGFPPISCLNLNEWLNLSQPYFYCIKKWDHNRVVNIMLSYLNHLKVSCT